MLHGKTLGSSQGRLDLARLSSKAALLAAFTDMSVSGASMEITNSEGITERFNLYFKTDGTRIPCRVVWRRDERIGVAFD
jgi:hypothetical protein